MDNLAHPTGPKAVTLYKSPEHSPTVDVIHPKDAIHPTESKSSKEIGLEQQKDVSKIQEERVSEQEVLKSLIPSVPKRDWPPWAMDYLNAMLETRTDGAACNKIGIRFRNVYEHRLAFKDFDAAVLAARAYRDKLLQTDLEEVSRIQALKPGCVIERIFTLKSLDPDTYRDKATGMGGVNIQIVMGHPIGRSEANIIDAEEE